MCIYMYVCMYVRQGTVRLGLNTVYMYVCMYVNVYVYIRVNYVWMYVCMYACKYVYLRAIVYVPMYVYVYV